MHKGLLEFEYNGRHMGIEYTLSPAGYGGLPLLSVVDKNKVHHTFVRGTRSGWGAVGKEPSWPRDFLDILYTAFEEEYQELSK